MAGLHRVTDDTTHCVEDLLAALDAELVGLDSVKRRVREIASLLQLDQTREQFGLTSSRPTLHMGFTGGPGTGKTAVARRMASILFALGHVRSPSVHILSRHELAARWTKDAGAIAWGGVLLVDAVHGQAAVDALYDQIDDDSSELVVIFAGYQNQMEELFIRNPGLKSRVPHHVDLPDYDHTELMQIAEVMVSEENFLFDDEAREVFAEYLTLRMARPDFANARSVRNAIERCRLRQARRLVALERPLGRQDLVTLTAEDIRGSSLFSHQSATGD